MPTIGEQRVEMVIGHVIGLARPQRRPVCFPADELTESILEALRRCVPEPVAMCAVAAALVLLGVIEDVALQKPEAWLLVD
jgi:hypothetical protein